PAVICRSIEVSGGILIQSVIGNEALAIVLQAVRPQDFAGSVHLEDGAAARAGAAISRSSVGRGADQVSMRIPQELAVWVCTVFAVKRVQRLELLRLCRLGGNC